MQYTYIFIYIGDTYRCMSIYVRKYTCGAHTYTPNRMQAHLHTCVHMHAHTFTRVHHTLAHVYLPMYTNANTYTHLSTPTHDWLCVHVWVCVMCLGVCMWVRNSKNRWESWKSMLGSLRWWYSFRPNHVRAVACVPVGVLCVCVRVCEFVCGCGCLCTSTHRRGVDLVRPISTKS